MDIEKIRDEVFTEDFKMELIADYLKSEAANPDLDKVLKNGNIATGKDAKFETTGDKHNFSIISPTQVATQKEYADGAAIVQITSDGRLSLDYGPVQGNPSFFTIEMNGGQPRVLMSDDMKAAFRTALGI